MTSWSVAVAWRDHRGRAALGEGKLVKVYPEIEGGRVWPMSRSMASVTFFVGERTLVWIPVATRKVITVPAAAVMQPLRR